VAPVHAKLDGLALAVDN
jgi:hypothetical protein